MAQMRCDRLRGTLLYYYISLSCHMTEKYDMWVDIYIDDHQRNLNSNGKDLLFGQSTRIYVAQMRRDRMTNGPI